VSKVEHHAALPWKEVGAFMARLVGQPGTGALALRFTILTAARTGEVIGARWSEIDMEAATWTIPGERMKAGVLHKVPLSGPALDVLRVMLPARPAKSDGYVFPGKGKDSGLSNMSLSAVLRRMDLPELTVHGFRSCFRDWAAEATAHDSAVVEKALAHTIPSKVEKAYRRGDLFKKRQPLMADWAAFCAATTSNPETEAA
jgi:integrase